MKRPIFWKIFPSSFLTAIAAIFIVSLILNISFKKYFHAMKMEELKTIAYSFQDMLTHQPKNSLELESFCKNIVKKHDISIIVYSSPEKILCTNNTATQNSTKRYAYLVNNAFNGKNYSKILSKNVLGDKDILHIASALSSDKKIYVIELIATTSALNETLNLIYKNGSTGFILLFLGLALFTWKQSQSLSKPLEDINRSIKMISTGNLNEIVPFNNIDTAEASEAVSAMQNIATQLNDRLNNVLAEKNQKDAVFSSMSEGVIAIDSTEKVLHINHSAQRILEISTQNPTGKSIPEVIRYPGIQSFITNTIKNKTFDEKEFQIMRKDIKYITIHISPLDRESQIQGVVLVISDITKLKELENHRKEFVENVSHELRTPLTNIQGYVETLLNTKVTDEKICTNFLNIINKNSLRLNQLIEDLLELSKLEQDSTIGPIALKKQEIKPILENAKAMCETYAQKHFVSIEIECEDKVVSEINDSLLETALVNLITNAIKFSPKNGKVILKASATDSKLEISVKDFGIGIPEESQNRLFERFYRVNKSRSRNKGGTGLGLAIVKHIAIAHNGQVKVRSQPQKGSEFFMILGG